MTIPLDIFDIWDGFLLVFVRVTGLFVVSPVFGRQNIPAYFMIGFSFFMAVVLSYTIPVPDTGSYNRLFAFILLVVKEFIIGLVLGYLSYLITTAIYLAGQMIDMHIGFGMVNVLDPVSNIQIPVTPDFYFILTVLMFLAIDGHHLLIYTLADSFSRFPVGSAVVIEKPLLDSIVRLFGSVFVISFKIAAPVTAAILVVDVALGVIAKAVPQLNVFIVGLPIKILIGLIVILFTLVAFRNIVHVLTGGMQSEMTNFFELIRGE